MDIYNSRIATIFRFFFSKTPEYAVTIGHNAYYTCDESEVTPVWHSHENQHKVQWARDGKVKFVARYLWQYCLNGYQNIDYEIEARAIADNYK